MMARPTRVSAVPWVSAFVALAVVTTTMVLYRQQLDKAHVALLYVLVVLGGSARGSRALGLALGGAAFLLFNFLFLPPYYTLTISDPRDWLILVAFLTTSVVAAELLHRQRQQTRLAEQRRRELDQLAALGAETLNAPRAELALLAIATVIRTSVNVSRCELSVRDDSGLLRCVADSDARPVAPTTADASNTSTINSTEPEGLLQYIVKTGQAAIAQADGTIRVVKDLPVERRDANAAITGATAYAIPLAVRGTNIGALRLSDREPYALSTEQHRTLTTLAYYAALGIDRLRLERSEAAAQEYQRMDALKDALLAAVSHDLRTPLTTIKAIAHEIAAGGNERAATIEDETDRLAKLVEGLLELSQLNAGVAPVRLELETLDDLVGVAIARSASALAEHRVETDIDDTELLVGRFDFAQSLRILTNLLENAAKYSPIGSTVQLSAWRDGDALKLSVSDRGGGIAPAEQARIFEPFFRGHGATADVRGAGLGLSIAKQLAVAQGGDLLVGEREGGGSVFTLVLNAGSAPAM